MLLFRSFSAFFIIFLITGCLSQEQNIQSGNVSGKIADNKWDYYKGLPIHYTSSQIIKFQDKVLIKNELTDAFSGTLTVNDKKKNVYVTFNGKTFVLNKFSDQATKDLWVDNYFEKGAKKDVEGTSRSQYYSWTDWYQDETGKFGLFIQRDKNIFLTTLLEGSNKSQSVLYYPSRYLACKKITEIMLASNQKMVASLLKTALVAGVQSYTSYSTYNYSDAYGNFGYATARDYSWAGDRAGDALTSVFDGNSDRASLDAAWSELNCW